MMSKIIEIGGERFELRPLETIIRGTYLEGSYALKPLELSPGAEDTFDSVRQMRELEKLQEPKWEVTADYSEYEIAIYFWGNNRPTESQMRAIKEAIEALMERIYGEADRRDPELRLEQALGEAQALIQKGKDSGSN